MDPGTQFSSPWSTIVRIYPNKMLSLFVNTPLLVIYHTLHFTNSCICSQKLHYFHRYHRTETQSFLHEKFKVWKTYFDPSVQKPWESILNDFPVHISTSWVSVMIISTRKLKHQRKNAANPKLKPKSQCLFLLTLWQYVLIVIIRCPHQVWNIVESEQ